MPYLKNLPLKKQLEENVKNHMKILTQIAKEFLNILTIRI